jgi:hypothetical protein
VGDERPVEVKQYLAQLLAPAIWVGLRQRHLTDELVEHQLQQLVAAGDVRVQRRRAGSQLFGHAAHRQAGHACLVERLDRGRDDRVERQRGPAGRAAPAVHPRG